MASELFKEVTATSLRQIRDSCHNSCDRINNGRHPYFANIINVYVHSVNAFFDRTLKLRCCCAIFRCICWFSSHLDRTFHSGAMRLSSLQSSKMFQFSAFCANSTFNLCERSYRAMLCIRGTSHGPVCVCLLAHRNASYFFSIHMIDRMRKDKLSHVCFSVPQSCSFCPMSCVWFLPASLHDAVSTGK